MKKMPRKLAAEFASAFKDVKPVAVPKLGAFAEAADH
jgi:hypothetical protein